MSVNVNAVVRGLMRAPMAEVKSKYLEVHGEPTHSGNREYLVKRIAWRMQANAEGGLSERARRRAEELANDADLRLRAPRADADSPGVVVTAAFKPKSDARTPAPGTLLKRQYKGGTIVVRVLARGFEYEGEIFRSLTAVATKVTGSHWNGHHFFRLAKAQRSRKEAS